MLGHSLWQMPEQQPGLLWNATQLAFIYVHKIKDFPESGHIFLCQLSCSNL